GHLFLAIAGDALEAGAGVEDRVIRTGGVGDDDALSGGLDGAIAQAQFILCFFAGAYIVGNTQQADGPSVWPGQRRGVNVDPDPRAVLLVVFDLTAPLHPAEALEHASSEPGPAVFRPALAQVPAEHLLGRPAEQPSRPLVPVGDGPIQVGDDDRVADVGQDQGVTSQGLGVAPLLADVADD